MKIGSQTGVTYSYHDGLNRITLKIVFSAISFQIYFHFFTLLKFISLENNVLAGLQWNKIIVMVKWIV